MKILLFGTGDYYRKYKKWFRTDDIVALVDNNPNKSGTDLDGFAVYLPEDAVKLEYDLIVILSVHEIAMRKQLQELGVSGDRIMGYADLHSHPELCTSPKPLDFSMTGEAFYDIVTGSLEEYILVMSHNLDLNGAALALFYAARILKKNGRKLLFVSWNDGELKKYLMEGDIPVIIDPNLEVGTAKSIRWIRSFDKMICNTLNYYLFLSDRRETDKIIWWLHDPAMFYETIDKDILRRIDPANLQVVAAGPISEAAMKGYRPDMQVKQLLYGLPDCDICKRKTENEKLELVTIGNVQEYKGQDLLVEAISGLSQEERQKVHLRIVGSQDSAFADAVKARAQELGGTIDFIPPADRETIQKILGSVDVLVCPSRVDTMSISSSEAMQHAVPCIVSDSTGIASYIHNEVDGLIFQCGSAEDLMGKVRWCLNNRNRLTGMGDVARKIYEKYFSMDVFEERLLNTLKFLYGFKA